MILSGGREDVDPYFDALFFSANFPFSMGLYRPGLGLRPRRDHDILMRMGFGETDLRHGDADGMAIL